MDQVLDSNPSTSERLPALIDLELAIQELATALKIDSSSNSHLLQQTAEKPALLQYMLYKVQLLLMLLLDNG
jgi:hypothetical protein